MAGFLILLVAFIGCVTSDTCVHNNHNDLTEEHVINMVVSNADHDDDGVITGLDINQFLQNYDANNDFEVDITEFVYQWVQTYHDERAFAEHIFRHLDTDDNGLLDFADIVALTTRADTSGDGAVQVSEFKKYLEDIYQAC